MGTAISLFCGAGGCSLGFKQAGYKILMATDIDKAAIETYKLNFPETDTLLKNIDDIDFNEVMVNYDLKEGELDFLIGGPPCQGFSTAGTRFWDDPRNHLLKSYINALKIMKPKWFMMENVEGLLTSNKGIYVTEAVKAFTELGYKVRVEKVYSQEYGVPQRRKRVIVLGNSLGMDFSMPKPTAKVTGQIFRNSDVTLQNAIESLPDASPKRNHTVVAQNFVPRDEFDSYLRAKTEEITEHFFTPLKGIQLERVSALRSGQTMKDLPEHLQHESFKKRANRRVADGTPTEKRGGAPSGMKRLHSNEPCLTITGAATRELIHPFHDRPLTIREAARVQTFPDNFLFFGNSSQKIQQIGNAIPPILARTIAIHVEQKYGFTNKSNSKKGELLGFALTKAGAMSPALKKTNELLASLMSNRESKQKEFILEF
ncbi:DNA cytosine methyltransferase [Pseudoalteromonas arabiensis]|uniref:DNA cytosine methyltransferase n=1 Tax=Pseudoalteromonas arabiensis TaxID=874454 RepID=UPI000784B7D8|nr:DNA cytosine methyltransferase [Pseudoalteromonas arabiensis]